MIQHHVPKGQKSEKAGQRCKMCDELLPNNEGWELSPLDIESVELGTASASDNKFKTLEPHATKEEAQILNGKFPKFHKRFFRQTRTCLNQCHT